MHIYRYIYFPGRRFACVQRCFPGRVPGPGLPVGCCCGGVVEPILPPHRHMSDAPQRAARAQNQPRKNAICARPHTSALPHKGCGFASCGGARCRCVDGLESTLPADIFGWSVWRADCQPAGPKAPPKHSKNALKRPAKYIEPQIRRPIKCIGRWLAICPGGRPST